ncbi:MAG TPA: hypothetical protein VKM35_03690 [Arenimonas sp.]|uniref:hypothetical protein n=1 Tax=Arenimonas sp. TaxID=1872635 RepID=UPI002BEEF3C3|nr:hypothetical protein [Arenimonas sp.]HMB56292.1 hypothetical protein [Arenimonas sp.]
MIRKILAAAALASIASPCCAAVAPADIAGQWKCGQYSIKGPDTTVNIVDEPAYAKDGSFSELSTATMIQGGLSVTTRTRLQGSWKLADGIIDIHFDSAKFISSDSRDYTLAMGQEDANARLKRKNWAKKKVLEAGKHLVTQPVEATTTDAVTCTRAG